MNMARGFLGRSLGREPEMIALPMIWFTAAVPLAFALILIHLLADLAVRFARLEHHNEAASREPS